MCEKYEKMKELIDGMAADVDKLYNGNNKSAGRRLRQKIQEIRNIGKDWRVEIQEVRNQDKDDK